MAEITYDIKKTYAELDSWIAGLTEGTYNVEVDCSGVNGDQFKGKSSYPEEASSFGKKLQAAKSGVKFNLKPININPEITDCSYMFYNCTGLTTIDTSVFTQVTNAYGMFMNCKGLKEIDTSAFTQVNNASRMFMNCTGLKTIDTSAFTQVNNAYGMFQGCSGLTEIIWGNIKPATNTDMFSGASATKTIGVADQQTVNWINTNETNMKLTNYTTYVNTYDTTYERLDILIPELTRGTYNLTIDCSGASASDFIGGDESGVRNPSKLSQKLGNVRDAPIFFNLIINFPDDATDATYCFAGNTDFFIKSVVVTSAKSIATTKGMFMNCKELTKIDCSAFKQVTNASQMFLGCQKLTTIDCSGFTKVTDASQMFVNCGLTEIDTSAFKQVINASQMFEVCQRLTTIDASAFAKVETADYMFDSCYKLTTITGASGFTQVNNAGQMFQDCSSLTSIDISGFTKAANADSMFQDCSSLTEIIWGEIKPTLCPYMFERASATKKIIISNQETADWIKAKETNMKLTNYSAYVINHTKKYSELDAFIPTLEAGIYNLTVDCTGVAADQFKGKNSYPEEASSFGKKLQAAKSGVKFNLKPININPEITDCSYMFYNCTGLTTIDTSAFTQVKNASYMFQDCTGLKTITGTSAFTQVNDASYMFYGCSGLAEIDTSAFKKVNNASFMFQDCINLTEIDTSAFTQVNNASGMFQGCSKLTTIDTSAFKQVTNANNMFYNCTGLTTIDTSVFKQVINANNMFQGCSKLTTIDCSGFTQVKNASYMFYDCTKLTTIGTSAFTQVTNASYMFSGCIGLTTIDTSAFTQVNDASYMFILCENLTTITGTSGFTQVNNANSMFANCSKLISVDTSAFTQVNDASGMFANCSKLTEIIWGNIKPATNAGMFSGASATKTIEVMDNLTMQFIENNKENMALTNYEFIVQIYYSKLDNYIPTLEAGDYDLTINFEGVEADQFKGIEGASPFGKKLTTALDGVYFNINPINVSPDITIYQKMFLNCANLKAINCSAFDKATDATNMFQGCANLIEVTGLEYLTQVTDATNMFLNCANLKTINCSAFDKITDATNMFQGCANLIEVTGLEYLTQVTDATNMFSDCANLKTIDTSAFTRIIDLNSMFKNCTGLTTIDCSRFIQAQDATSLFQGCSNLIEVTGASGFNQVKNATNMFLDCIKLTEINASGFNQVANASSMFKNCTGLTTIISSDFTNVDNANSMFSNCSELTSIDVSTFTKIANATNMFENCSGLTAIDCSNFTNVTNTSNMFSGCLNLTTIRYGIKSPSEFNNMFNNIPEGLTVSASSYQAQNFLDTNKETLKLTNPKFIELYCDLDNYIPTLPTGLHKVVVDCKDTLSDQFFGTETETSSFGKKLSLAKPDVKISLSLINVDNSVTNINSMFLNCASLQEMDTLGLTNVLSADRTFMNCTSLKKVINTKVFGTCETCASIFEGCIALEEVAFEESTL